MKALIFEGGHGILYGDDVISAQTRRSLSFGGPFKG